jgi:hypothetical protein
LRTAQIFLPNGCLTALKRAFTWLSGRTLWMTFNNFSQSVAVIALHFECFAFRMLRISSFPKWESAAFAAWNIQFEQVNEG